MNTVDTIGILAEILVFVWRVDGVDIGGAHKELFNLRVRRSIAVQL
jgi:hypothetical protein